jgi:hypothetical protein
MPYQVKESSLKVTDQAYEDIRNYNPSGAEDFTLGLICVMLDAISHEYERLRSGYDKRTVADEAWACRNLLELCVFVKWMLQSDANAKRLAADVAIDGTELFESMKKWMEHQTPGIKLPEMDETIRFANERRKSEGTLGERHLEVSVLADTVGMTEDYRHSMKLCSKLLHQTAWSIIHRDQYDGEYAAFPVMLFESGSRYGLDAFNTITEYLRNVP